MASYTFLYNFWLKKYTFLYKLTLKKYTFPIKYSFYYYICQQYQDKNYIIFCSNSSIFIYFYRQENLSVWKNYYSKGIHFAIAKFHFNEHNFFYTRTKRKFFAYATNFVRTFNRLFFNASSFCSGAKVCGCLKYCGEAKFVITQTFIN